MSLALVKPKKLPLYCSFCGKEKDEVGYLVAGPTVFICNECVELCRGIGHEILCKEGKANTPAFQQTERAIVDYFEVAGCDVEQEGLEWFLSLYDEGPSISLTGLAIAISPAHQGGES